jgi:hypothetical protein
MEKRQSRSGQGKRWERVGVGREQLRRVGMKRRQREKWEGKRKEEGGDNTVKGGQGEGQL